MSKITHKRSFTKVQDDRSCSQDPRTVMSFQAVVVDVVQNLLLDKNGFAI